jgi:hypothetical protein
MYNLLFGENNYSDALLKTLNLERDDFCRFRDVYLTEEFVIVYTRCGGGNREYYQDVFNDMKEHPLFDHDEDDDFDSTYCSFYFKIPEVLKAAIDKHRQEHASESTEEKKEESK